MTDQRIADFVGGILSEITQDWDVGEINPGTRLGDLGVESIALVYLLAEIQQHYGLEDALFERLRREGLNVVELRVGQLVAMVRELMLSRAAHQEAGS